MKALFAICMLAISVGLMAFLRLSTGASAPKAALTTAPAVNVPGTAAAALTPDFSLSTSPSVDNVAAGAGARFTVTVTSVNGTFAQPVVLEAAGLPPGATAHFSPVSVIPGARSATTTLTIQTVAQDAAILPGKPGSPSCAPSLALLLFVSFRVRGRSRLSAGCWTAILALAGMLPGCESGGALPLTETVASQATYSVKVTGTTGSTQHSVVTELLVQTGSGFNT